MGRNEMPWTLCVESVAAKPKALYTGTAERLELTVKVPSLWEYIAPATPAAIAPALHRDADVCAVDEQMKKVRTVPYGDEAGELRIDEGYKIPITG
jgi:hypothetical protein